MSNKPKSIQPCAASYSAEQVPGAVLIFARGVHPTSGYVVFFEKNPIAIFPPEFSLWHSEPSGVGLEVITPFSKYTSFKSEKTVEYVVIYDADGKHQVSVEQVPALAMRHMSASANPLTEGIEPDTPAKCVAWRDQDVRSRIRAAIAEWAQEPLASITSGLTLGELAKGVPWGTAQQIQLVETTNQHGVFAPFDSTMPNPDTQPDSTTVSDWEDVVWDNQQPQTFCFPYGN